MADLRRARPAATRSSLPIRVTKCAGQIQCIGGQNEYNHLASGNANEWSILMQSGVKSSVISHTEKLRT